MRQYAAGVCLLTVRDDIDDVGTTVTSVMSVSADPPVVAVGLAAGGYPAEVLVVVLMLDQVNTRIPEPVTTPQARSFLDKTCQGATAATHSMRRRIDANLLGNLQCALLVQQQRR